MRHLLALCTIAPFGLALAHGCSSGGGAGDGSGAFGGSAASGGAQGGSAGGDSDASAGSSGSSSGGTVGVGGSGTGGSSTGGGSQDANIPDVTFAYDAAEPDAKLCVDETVNTQAVPLDIYFMLDASTSMSIPVGSGSDGDCSVAPPFTPTSSSRWCKAVNAIAGYISSPQAAGNQAAIQYFETFNGNNCGGSLYNTPAVGLGTLTGAYNGHAQTLVEQSPGGLNWAYPHSLTPTEGALNGIAQFTAANKTPGRIIIGILVTDGLPILCNTSDIALKAIVQNHFNATGIHTFIVGINGADFNRLENWASYTGALQHDDTNDACGNCSNCNCHHYNVGDGSPAVFISALQSIQNAVLACSFQVPTPANGVLNPDAVNVEYYPGGNPPPTLLPKVANAAACTGPGWYYEYDANMKPTTIQLCPASCNTVQTDTNAQVKIRIACQGS